MKPEEATAYQEFMAISSPEIQAFPPPAAKENLAAPA
jgi:hypothetical protein